MTACIIFSLDPNSLIDSDNFYYDTGASGWDDKYFFNPSGFGEITTITKSQLSYSSEWTSYDSLISKNLSFDILPQNIPGQVRNRTDFMGDFSSNDSLSWSYNSVRRFIDFRAEGTSSVNTYEIYSWSANFSLDDTPTFYM